MTTTATNAPHDTDPTDEPTDEPTEEPLPAPFDRPGLDPLDLDLIEAQRRDLDAARVDADAEYPEPPLLSELPEIVTVAEAAAVLRVSTRTAYEAVRMGELPATKVRGSWRVPRRALERIGDA